MVKAAKILPPDPRPWKAEPQSRRQRKEFEKENGGFDWGQAFALGLIGATVVFGIDKSLRRTEEKHEEEDRREERRRQRQRQSRSRPPRSNPSQAGWDRDRERDRDERSFRDERSVRDDRSDMDYYDQDWDEREYKSVRDYAPPESEPPEPRTRMREGSARDGSVRDEREYFRAVDQFDRDYGYGRRYDEHKRSRSNPASRSRDYW
ncbi:hypothetical protein CGRA01v4_12771 [Colletotrichum graminicola]|uniref:Uncharacterized protein n=1 Tax=Colletotrichum graminicola (strain M1.001 / M2 / FGSC 10212) TaxID=645133 RepID=E3QIB5_COLGM|nr:uncharacterized protein GLRG_05874 [Colletotrichum graminicola M1.001]EFQ30730.1 hypothetical protein GLRG_05874 [Colletotrichum graminicola M1.001]WDK21481.1 hypothetical protein CGRA01v4_12771 [Colletotrichum graminicola]